MKPPLTVGDFRKQRTKKGRNLAVREEAFLERFRHIPIRKEI